MKLRMYRERTEERKRNSCVRVCPAGRERKEALGQRERAGREVEGQVGSVLGRGASLLLGLGGAGSLTA